jgi:hypothetical protein
LLNGFLHKLILMLYIAKTASGIHFFKAIKHASSFIFLTILIFI